MASTDFGVNDSLAVKLWSRTLSLQSLDATDIKPLIGDDENSVIQMKTDLSKGPGDQITYGLQIQLQGAGFTENELAEGNGESLAIYSDKLTINELGHVVGVKSRTRSTLSASLLTSALRREWGCATGTPSAGPSASSTRFAATPRRDLAAGPCGEPKFVRAPEASRASICENDDG